MPAEIQHLILLAAIEPYGVFTCRCLNVLGPEFLENEMNRVLVPGYDGNNHPTNPRHPLKMWQTIYENQGTVLADQFHCKQAVQHRNGLVRAIVKLCSVNRTFHNAMYSAVKDLFVSMLKDYTRLCEYQFRAQLAYNDPILEGERDTRDERLQQLMCAYRTESAVAKADHAVMDFEYILKGILTIAIRLWGKSSIQNWPRGPKRPKIDGWVKVSFKERLGFWGNTPEDLAELTRTAFLPPDATLDLENWMSSWFVRDTTTRYFRSILMNS